MRAELSVLWTLSPLKNSTIPTQRSPAMPLQLAYSSDTALDGVIELCILQEEIKRFAFQKDHACCWISCHFAVRFACVKASKL